MGPGDEDAFSREGCTGENSKTLSKSVLDYVKEGGGKGTVRV